MRRGYQISLYGDAPGRGRLFQQGILSQYLDDHRTTPIPHHDRKRKLMADWLRSVEATTATEASLEQRFTETILTGVFGYSLYPPSTGESTASIYPKPSSRVTGLSRTPDLALGQFGPNGDRIDAVLELKTPGCGFDAPQPRAQGETPVEQAFHYGTRILGVRWVLVSDMRTIRLYSVESDGEYEEFDLKKCTLDHEHSDREFRRAHFLLHRRYLIEGADEAPVSRLFTKSAADQLRIRDNFYEVYSEIRADVYREIRKATARGGETPKERYLLEATQRLLDRLLFIYYCEDHPEQLIPNHTVRQVVEAASSLPGRQEGRIYEYVKQLFREVDEGSHPTSGLNIVAYNGELFKHHELVDEISLPDKLSHTRYVTQERDGRTRTVNGIYGLHVYDFWSELNEHLLGHIFEQSLSDIEGIAGSGEDRIASRLVERKRMGVYYTSSLLSDFLSSHAIAAVLSEEAPLTAESTTEIADQIQERRDVLTGLRICDFACGSGAFLVSAYRELLLEFWRLKGAGTALQEPRGGGSLDMFQEADAVSNASLLRHCLFGVDLLPQAVEIAKLALWLRSARKGEEVADLSSNLVAGDSLRMNATFKKLNLTAGSVDIVLGNPPWGSEIEDGSREEALDVLGLQDGDDWDSWELFVAMGLHALRPGGRLALVLPDSFLYPAKERVRRMLLENGDIERLLVLGPEWFGPDVRMGSIVLQFRKGTPNDLHFIQGTLLAGRLRRRVLRGEVPLTQVEAQRSRELPAARIRRSEGLEVEVFRGAKDDAIIEQMETRSRGLAELCHRARGEEINKAGRVWVCPSCRSPNTPGAKMKGGGYRSKDCVECEHTLEQSRVEETLLVRQERPPDREAVPYIDGDDVNGRYKKVEPHKWWVTDVEGWTYKAPETYAGPKLLIRQAGVGLVLTLDETDAHCPQSVYLYRLTPEARALGYNHLFLLGVLSTRTMAYFLFKRFGEVDPDKAHAKVTHVRLASLPIPKLDDSVEKCRQLVETVVGGARKILQGRERLGSREDWNVEMAVRELWGISPENGAYINREFFDLPDSQVIRDLFPDGPPNPMGV